MSNDHYLPPLPAAPAPAWVSACVERAAADGAGLSECLGPGPGDAVHL